METVDLAHAILKESGEPLYYRDLIDRILTAKPLQGKDHERIMAGIHTELNLDRRFVHVGKGVWGLREWMPDKGLIVRDTEEDWDN